MTSALKYPLLVFLLSVVLFTGYANASDPFEKNYAPISNQNVPKGLTEAINEVFKSNQANISTKYQKEFKTLQKINLEYLMSSIDSSDFYFDTIINPYFQNIFSSIIKSNPAIQSLGLRLFVSRSTIPNAYAMGNGILVFNIGMLRYMENESQIAFVICHEIAHNTELHVFKRLESTLDKLYSKSTQEELKRLKRTEFNTFTQAEQLYKNLKFDIREHGREHESEADSLGLILLSKTDYSIEGSLRTFKILDSTDYEKYRDSIELDQFFSFESYPFKSRWIQENSFILMEDKRSKESIDSMKTHPDCSIRYEKIKNIIERDKMAKGRLYVQDSALFHQLVQIADFEGISNEYKSKNLSRSLYFTLQLLKKYPENKFLQSYLIKNFELLVSGLENYKLSDYLYSPSPYHKGDYKKLNLFLNNIRFSEATKILAELNNKYQL